jgi:hypothetical protein
MAAGVGVVKALHFYNVHSNSNGRFLHDRTAIVHSEGFFYIIWDASDQKAKKKRDFIMNKSQEYRKKRELEGKPFLLEDWMKLSQTYHLSHFVGKVNTYESVESIDEVIAKERAIFEGQLSQDLVLLSPIETVSKKLDRNSPEFREKFSSKQLAKLIFPMMTAEIAEDCQQVFEDYPELVEAFDEGPLDIDTPGYIEFLFAKLGPIDPEGPNGWFLEIFDYI